MKNERTKAVTLTIFAVAIMLTSSLAMVTAIHADSAASETSSDWPMFHHDPAHTGYTHEVVNPPLEVKWKYETGNWVDSSPAVANGMVYVGSEDGNVYAFAPSVPVEPSVSPTPSPSPPPTIAPTPTPPPTAAAPTPTSTPSPPGFEAVFAIASLLAIAYFVRRREKA